MFLPKKNQTTAWDKIPEYQSVRVSKARGRSLVLVKQGATVKQSQCENRQMTDVDQTLTAHNLFFLNSVESLHERIYILLLTTEKVDLWNTMQVKHGELSRNLNRFKVRKDLRFTQRTADIASTTMTRAVFVIAQ